MRALVAAAVLLLACDEARGPGTVPVGGVCQYDLDCVPASAVDTVALCDCVAGGSAPVCTIVAVAAPACPCAAGLACTSSGKTCVKPKLNGLACGDAAECLSRNCSAGRCESFTCHP